MSDSERKKQLYDFIHKHKIAVVSTVTPGGKPSAAVVEFGETENLELIFDTLSYYRKFTNLKNNQQVAFVIGWDDNVTVQYEGIAEELKGEELNKYQEIFFKKNPKASRWLAVEGITYYKVCPTWIRYSDLTVHPWQIFEISF